MNGLIRMGLGFAGVSDALAVDIEQQVPGAQRLIAAARKLEPSFIKLAPLVAQAEPIVLNEIWPVIVAEYPDLMHLLPVAQQVFALLQKGSTVAATSPAVKDSKFGG